MTITYAPGHSPDAVAAAFRAMAERSRNLQPVMVVAAEAVTTLMKMTFRNESSPDGTPWAANAQRTIDRRRAGKGPKTTKIGVDTGILRATMSTRPDIGTNWLKFGTNVSYGAPFHAGAKRSGVLKHNDYKTRREEGMAWSVTQPPRPILPITPQGNLMTGGPAGKTFARISAAVGKYITTGRLR